MQVLAVDLGTGRIGSTGGSSGEPTRPSILPNAGLLGVGRPLVGGRHYMGDKCGKKFLSRLHVETKDLGGRVAKDQTDLHLNQLFLLPSMPCGKTGMPALPSELAMECCRCIAGRHAGGMVGGVPQRVRTSWPGTAGRFVNCRRIELSALP